jgi:hypothetical protein
MTHSTEILLLRCNAVIPREKIAITWFIVKRIGDGGWEA